MNTLSAPPDRTADKQPDKESTPRPGLGKKLATMAMSAANTMADRLPINVAMGVLPSKLLAARDQRAHKRIEEWRKATLAHMDAQDALWTQSANDSAAARAEKTAHYAARNAAKGTPAGGPVVHDGEVVPTPPAIEGPIVPASTPPHEQAPDQRG